MENHRKNIVRRTPPGTENGEVGDADNERGITSESRGGG